MRKVRVLSAYPAAALRHPARAARFLACDREVTNFTYDIENVAELVNVVAAALSAQPAMIAGYVEELQTDHELHADLATRLRSRPDRNPKPRFGRRLGWYAVVRALKPRVVVETGVHDGLGSAALLRALDRNAAEGIDGRLIGFDIDPTSGWLVGGEFAKRFHLVVGDSARTLERSLRGLDVGVFVHDSAHTFEHEWNEFTIALPHMTLPFGLLSDNAHATTALAEFCARNSLDYTFFRERPHKHFYPGAGIGLGIAKRTT